MKRMTRILSLGLLLSISTVALAGKGNDRNGTDGYYDHSGRQHHNARYDDHDNRYRNDRNDDRYREDRHERRQHAKHHRHGKRHYVNNKRHASRHSHHGYDCYDGHPRGYVAARMHYRYGSPEFVIAYQPGAGLHINGGR